MLARDVDGGREFEAWYVDAERGEECGNVGTEQRCGHAPCQGGWGRSKYGLIRLMVLSTILFFFKVAKKIYMFSLLSHLINT